MMNQVWGEKDKSYQISQSEPSIYLSACFNELLTESGYKIFLF